MTKLLRSIGSFAAAATACLISANAAEASKRTRSLFNSSAVFDLGKRRPEGTHALTPHDVEELGIVGGSGKFVLVAEFFYGGVQLVDVGLGTTAQIVPSAEYLERGGLGVTAFGGHILVAGGGPLVALPFNINIFDAQGELVTTCVPPDDVEAGIMNDFAIVGDVAYVTDSLKPRLWRFDVPAAIGGDCHLEYDELGAAFDPTPETVIESNGIAAYGDGFVIPTFGSGGLYYVKPAAGITGEEIIPNGTFGQPDGLELVEEDDGTMTLYVTVGVTNNLWVYKLSSQRMSEVPRATLVDIIENEAYDTPATSAVLGDMIYTANLRGTDLPLLEVGEGDLETFNERFGLVGTSRVPDCVGGKSAKRSKGSKSSKRGKAVKSAKSVKKSAEQELFQR